MDLVDSFRYLAALLFVLGLIGGLYYLLRRFGPGAALMVANAGRGAASQRLDVVESRTIDIRRRLILIRRDDVEHLVLLGQDGDMVVERGIAAPSAHSPDRKDRSRPKLGSDA
jgi:flagellar protein FliO/FliZ